MIAVCFNRKLVLCLATVLISEIGGSALGIKRGAIAVGQEPSRQSAASGISTNGKPATRDATEKYGVPNPAAGTGASSRWAIVALDQNSKSLADLLTAEISAWSSVELVEREDIDRVLTELKLNASGLVEEDSMVQFGRLAKADALAMLSWEMPATSANVPPAISNSQSVVGLAPRAIGPRLRLVETASAVRLLDVVLPAGSLSSSLKSLGDELLMARAKVLVPASDRLLVGILMIKSEEPGEYLTTFCRALTTLVESELHRQPKVLMLERNQLQRLTDESALTGAELSLKHSMRLLEVGIRRTNDGRGLVAICRLNSPGTTQSSSFQVTTKTLEVVDARSSIVDAVIRHLGSQPPSGPAVDLEPEALEFDRRRALFEAAYRSEEAVEMAEAALALAPTRDRLQRVLLAYQLWLRVNNNGRSISQALAIAIQYRQCRLSWLDRSRKGDLIRAIESGSAFDPVVSFYIDGRVPSELLEQREVADRLAISLWERLLAEAGTDKQRYGLLLDRLVYAPYYAASGEEFVKLLPELLEEIEQAMRGTGIEADLKDADYCKYIGYLFQAVAVAVQQADDSGRNSWTRPWKEDSLAGLESVFVNRNDSAAKVAQLIVRIGKHSPVGETKPSGVQAARDLWKLVENWPPIRSKDMRPFRDLKDFAMYRLDGATWSRILDDLLTRAEQTKDPTELLASQMPIMLKSVARTQEIMERNRRLLAILKLDHPATKSDSAKSWARQLEVLTNHAANAKNRPQTTPESKPVPLPPNYLPMYPGPLSLENAPGLWQRYTAVPLFLSRDTPEFRRGAKDVFLDRNTSYFQLFNLYVDRRTDARQRGGELILLVARPNGKRGLERYDIATRTKRRISPDLPGPIETIPSLYYGNPPIAFSPSAIFVTTGAPGFQIVENDTVVSITQADGAPSDAVHQLAWFKDRLYVAFDDAFASFDPKARKFEILATSVSVAPRNPIDGRGGFLFWELIADEAHQCLWISLVDKASHQERFGWWQFKPQSKEFTLVKHEKSRRQITSSWTSEGLLLKMPTQPNWAMLNHAQANFSWMNEYAAWEPQSRRLGYSPRFVMLGDHIITGNGEILSQDGKTHQANTEVSWPWLDAVAEGLITFYDQNRSVLWYVQPKATAPPEAERASMLQFASEADVISVQRNHQQNLAELMQLRKTMKAGGAEGAKAAQAIIDRLFPFPPGYPEIGGVEMNDFSHYLSEAAQSLPTDSAKLAFLDRIVDEAERTREPRFLVYWQNVIFSGMLQLPNPMQLQLFRRIDPLLKSIPESDHVFVKALSSRDYLLKNLEARGIVPRRQPSLENAPAAWSPYKLRSMPLQMNSESYALYAVRYDPSEYAAARDEQLILIGARKFGKLSVERASIQGGKSRQIGPELVGELPSFHPIPFASNGQGTMFVSSATPGIHMVSERATEKIETANGAPGGVVQAMAWLDSKLYVTFENLFTAFDPVARKFKVLASAKAEEDANPLNGNVGYFIFRVLADSENHCLWFHLQDNTAGMKRAGLWRYDPSSDRFTHIFRRVPESVLSEDAILVVQLDDTTYGEVDRRTNSIRTHATLRPVASSISHSLAVGSFIVRSGGDFIRYDGSLFSQDGKVHRLDLAQPWNYLQRTPVGILTHYDEQERRLWFIERQ